MSRTTNIARIAKWVAAAAGLALVTLPGVLCIAFERPVAISFLQASLVTTGGTVCAILLLVCHRPSTDLPSWCVAVSAASLAALMPLASDSARAIEATYAALLLVSLAVAACRLRPSGAGEMLGSALTAVAIVLDATALAWAVGCGWAWLATWRVRAALLMIVAIAAGLIVRLSADGIGAGSAGADLFDISRDLRLLMPVVLIGGIGLASRNRCGAGRTHARCVSAWTGASIVGVFAALLGLPVTAAILVLPFWWSAPSGLVVLSRMLGSARSSGLSRACAALVVLAALAFAVPAGQRWWEGVLLGLYSLLHAG